jgi:hypothetical protein
VLLKEVGTENILLYTTLERMASLNSPPLIIDTGYPKLDEQPWGFNSVSTDNGKCVHYNRIPLTKRLEQPET